MFLSILLPLSQNLTPSLCSYHIVCTRCKTIVVPYVDTNAKVTNFFPFCTIGISMYQKRILPYIIIPYFLTPSFFPFGALQTDGQTTFFTPRYLSSFFSTERAGPYPQAQLYWAGRTMGWMADWTRSYVRSILSLVQRAREHQNPKTRRANAMPSLLVCPWSILVERVEVIISVVVLFVLP